MQRPHLVAVACLAQLLLVIAVPLTQGGADYAREKKWADEITPGLVVGDPVYLEGRAGHRFLTLYTEATAARAGLVIVHGIGVHPDWGLIGVLRGALADHAYTTLSVQMPILAGNATPEEYPPTFDEAAERLARAVDFLRVKGHTTIAIVSHSMGSRMARHYLTRAASPAVAWVCIGLGGDGDFGQVKVPVLDLYGEQDLPSVLRAAPGRAASIKNRPGSKQVMAPRADHFFTGQSGELVRYVKDFLDKSL